MRRNLLFTLALSGALGVLAPLAAPAPAAAQVTAPARLIVGLQAGTITEFNARHRTTVIDSIAALPGVHLVISSDGRTADQLLAEVLANPAVAFAELPSPTSAPEVAGTRTIRAWADSSASAAGSQYAASLLRLPEAHRSATGVGVTVAVLDTGVTAMPSFGGRVVGGFDALDRDSSASDDRNGRDDDGDGIVDEGAGHGTHVAGIVHLTAPSASIMPIRVLDSEGNGDAWSLASGISWAVDHGAHVINASVGGRGSHIAVRRALDFAAARNVTVVAAAGNDGRERENFPAGDRCAIAVASSGPTDRVSSFSTTGSWVAVAAPGEGIVSSYPYMSSGFAS
jgi:hypothetical protein